MELPGKQETVRATALYRGQRNSENRSQTYTDEHHAYVSNLWIELDASFGRKFDDGGGIDSPKFMKWLDGTKGLTPAQFTTGTRSARLFKNHRGESWPPTLREFWDLCITPASHETAAPGLPKPKPRYSVMRIERAKQKRLTGQTWGVAVPADRYVMDWNGDDEAELCELIAQFEDIPDENPVDATRRLNRLIDHHEFSHGTQRGNTRP